MDDESRPVVGSADSPGTPAAGEETLRRADIHHRKPSPWRRLGIIALVLVLVVAGLGTAWYWKLNSNLTTVAIPDGIQGLGEPGTPLNIVVLGSDSRESKENCTLGNVCDDKSTNADVQMIVHVSADRSNATVVSIPRDTVVELPDCAIPATTSASASATPSASATASRVRGRINSTLLGGPACTITALHELSGLPIDHFAMVDFAGVVKMSDAIGGVDVCVDRNVYDPYSGLKLKKGKHTLKGVPALQFLRTRHGFGDGSDIGRTIGQHIFLSSMLRKLESAGTLLNPAKDYALAETATSVLTVDTGLGVKDLASLALMGAKIPTDHITFVTMPTTTDPKNRNAVVPASNADALFSKLAADLPYAPAATTSSMPSATASTTSGATASTPAAAAPATSTPATASPSTAATSTATPSASTGATTPAAPDYAASALDNTGCAQVSTFATVQYQGFGVTPSRAYELATEAGVTDSAY